MVFRIVTYIIVLFLTCINMTINGEVPNTGFECSGRFPGFYADDHHLTNCSVYHLCNSRGRKTSFICPQGTLFRQQFLVCAHAHEVNCAQSVEYYSVNQQRFTDPQPGTTFHTTNPSRETDLTTNPKRITTNTPNPPKSREVTIDIANADDVPNSLKTDDILRFPARIVPILKNSAITSRPTISTAISDILKFPARIMPLSKNSVRITTSEAKRITSPPISTTSTTIRPARITTNSVISTRNNPNSLIPGSGTSSKVPPTIATTKLNARIDALQQKPQLTLTFPEFGKQPFHGERPRNPLCPLCDPLYLTGQECSPCVIIR